MPAYTFGPFRLEPSERRLWREGQLVDIAPRAFDVLVVLASRAGHLVTKDELMAEVWGGAVVEDNALTVQISKLRSALGESARDWQYVETVSRQGYRFASAVQEEPSPKPAPYARAARRSRGVPLALGGVAVVAVIALAMALGASGSDPPPSPSTAATMAAQSEVSAEDRRAAREAYERGRAIWWTRRNLDDALTEFRAAAVLDPSFALAFVGEADVLGMQYQAGDEVRVSVDRAFALAPNLGEAHASLGLAQMLQDWDWDAAEASLSKARTLAPDHSPAHQWTATLQMIQGEADAAVASMDRALAVAPSQARPVLFADRCQALYLARRYDEAITDCRRAIDLDPEAMFVNTTGFWSLALAGRGDEAARWASVTIGSTPPALRGVSPADLAGPEGTQRLARRLLAQPPGENYFGSLHAGVKAAAFAGEHEQALDLFEELVRLREFHAPFLAVDPVFDALRDRPRFRAAVRQIGLDASD